MSSPTPTGPSYGEIFGSGLWWNNPGLAQLLGLCPLLAVSRTLITGIALGLATLFVVTSTNVLVSSLRRFIDPRLRLPAFVLLIAAFVTTVDLLFKARWFDLYLDIGLFIPLIATNCVILARAEAFAARNPVLPALADGLAHGLGFLGVLAVLGAVRELIGYGSLFRGAEILFGSGAASAGLRTTAEPAGLLLATLPAGAFFVLAVLIALRNASLQRQARARETPGPADSPATR